jgi:hypothetical protein
MMNKIEMGVIVTVIIAFITGALYIGNLQGRIQALETDKNYASIKAEKDAVLLTIKEAKETALAEFKVTNQRISSLEANWNKNRSSTSVIELPIGNGGAWGSYRGAKQCPNNHYVCGLEQRTEKKQGSDDDTGVTGIKFQCCPL